VLLAFGARWLTEGAVAVAAAFGVGERVIGLTVVAVGTSLPEVAASVVAALRGQRDLSVGNVVGSNLFNLLGVLGLAAVVAGEPVELPAGVLALDLPVALAGAVAVAPLALSGGRIDRLEGALLLAGYGAYTGWVLAGATFAERPGTGAALLAATALAGVVAVLAAFRHRGDGPPGTP
jgi:cation:H+ antiporter